MAADTQRKKPKVNRFRGNRSRLIIGLARSEVTIKTKPVIKSVSMPLPNTIPEAIPDTVYKT